MSRPANWYADTPVLDDIETKIYCDVKDHEGATPKEITDRTGLSKAVVAYRLRKLFYLGLVKFTGICGLRYTVSLSERRA